ncbi:MAG: hypothetical protein K2Y23_21560 [Cyanobacteria bacterium]|nr:hypothetical protein [Cyanobacteriota bacterium]
MEPLNRVLRAAVDAALSPLAPLPPIAAIAVVSLAVAVAMLLVVRRTSNQPAIAQVKRQIQASIFEIRLFNADIRALHSTIDVLRHNLTYLRLSLAPLPWVIVPMTLLVAHLQFYYGYEGFAPGQDAVFKVRIARNSLPPGGGRPRVGLEAPPGVQVQTPQVWIASEREAAWRIGFSAPGDYELRVTVDRQTVTKTVRVSGGIGRRSPGRYRAGLLSQVLYPAEPPMPPQGAVDAIEVSYPHRELKVLGRRVNWSTTFVGMALLFAWLLRSTLGVEL